MNKELVDSIKWIVPPSCVGDIVIIEEATVLNNPTEGVVILLYRSGDTALGLAIGAIDAINLAAMLNKAAQEINNKAN